jgi:hypothetical protein
MIGEQQSGQAKCTRLEHTAFEGEKKAGQMKGEKQCDFDESDS